MIEANRLVTAEEIARHFGVTVNTVYTWVRQGRIPHIRPSGGVIRFRLQDVERELTRAATEEGDDVNRTTTD